MQHISEIDEHWDAIKQHLIAEMSDYAQVYSSVEEFHIFLESGQYVDLLEP